MGMFDDAPMAGQSKGGLFDDAPMAKPFKMGREGFIDTLKSELANTDFATRNIAGFGTALSDLYEGAKQFVGAGDQTAIAANKAISDAAPLGAIAGNIAVSAVPFGLAGKSIKGATAVGAGMGALAPVEGEQTFDNIARGKVINTGLTAALGGAGQAVGNAAERYFAGKAAQGATEAAANATRDDALKAGFDAGFKVPPSSMDSSLGNTIRDSFGGKAALKQAASVNNQEMLQQAVRKRFGIPDNVPLDREALDAVIQNAYKRGYAPLENLGALEASPSYDAALRAITRTGEDASRSFPGMESPQLAKLVEGYRVIQPNSPAAEARDASGALAKMLAEKEASRINALQQSGQMQTEAAKQTTLANNFVPVPGMPRVPARLSNNAELAPRYQDAATDFAAIAGTRRNEKEVISAAKEYVDGLKDLSTGTFDAKHAIDTIRSLRQDVDAFYKSPVKAPADKIEADAKKQIAGAIERELEFSLKKMGRDGEAMLNRYRDSRRTIAEANTAKGAIVGDSLDASVWARRANQGKPLEGEFKTIGEFAARAPGAFQIPERIGGVGISALNATAGTMLGGGSLLAGGDPTTAAMLAAGPAGLRYLARQRSMSAPVQNALAQRMYGLTGTESAANELAKYLAPAGYALAQRYGE